jgi:hypothetical protein
VSYIAYDLELRPRDRLVGSGECVALVQEWAGAPSTGLWRQGDRVKGNHNIAKGTAIATFIDGAYPSNSSGNHAAIYLGQDGHGIRVIDQWTNARGPHKPQERTIRFKGGQGSLSDDGDAYSVIE